MNGNRTLLTDSLGRAVFGDLGAYAGYGFQIIKTGFQTINDKFSIANADTSKTVVLTPAYKLSFYVRDMQKMPVRGARVMLDGVLSQLTDSLGMVVFPNIAANTTHTYSLSKSGYLSSDGISGTVTSDKVIELWLTAQTYSFTFIVTDNGKAIKGANVAFDQQAVLLTDSLGRLTISNLAKGLHQYRVYKTGYADVSGSATIDTTNITRDIKFIPIVPSVKLTLWVKDDLGRLVKGSVVRLDNVKFATTDSLGRAVFTEVTPNIQHFYDILSTNVYNWGKGTINVAATDLSYETLLITKTYSITFNVEENGKVITNANIELDKQTVLPTDSLGRAIFSKVYVGAHQYRVYKTGYTDVFGTIRIDSLNVAQSIKFTRIPNYKLSFFVRDMMKLPVKGAKIVLDSSRTLLTDSLGMAAFTSITANSTHAYTVTKNGFVSLNGNAAVASTDQLTEIWLNPITYSLSVTVKDSLGAAITGAKVELDNYSTTVSDSSGRAVLKASTGVHTIKVSQLGFITYTNNVLIDSTNKSISVKLLKGQQPKVNLTIKVLDFNKKPLRGALFRPYN